MGMMKSLIMDLEEKTQNSGDQARPNLLEIGVEINQPYEPPLPGDRIVRRRTTKMHEQEED